MAITASDLLVPKGPLDSKLFPGLESRELTSRCTGYIIQAGDNPNIIAADVGVKGSMTKALSLYFAFRDIVIRMSNEPARIDVTEEGGHTYNAQQLQSMKEIRDGYLAEFQALIVPINPVAQSALPGTRSIRTQQCW